MPCCTKQVLRYIQNYCIQGYLKFFGAQYLPIPMQFNFRNGFKTWNCNFKNECRKISVPYQVQRIKDFNSEFTHNLQAVIKQITFSIYLLLLVVFRSTELMLLCNLVTLYYTTNKYLQYRNQFNCSKFLFVVFAET